MGHVSKDGEDGKPGNKTGNTVDGAGQQGIPGREREAAIDNAGPPDSTPTLLTNRWPPVESSVTPSLKGHPFFPLPCCHMDPSASPPLG